MSTLKATTGYVNNRSNAYVKDTERNSLIHGKLPAFDIGELFRSDGGYSFSAPSPFEFKF